MPYRIPPGAKGALAPHSERPQTDGVDEGEAAALSCALCQYVLAPRWRYCPLCGTHRSVRGLEPLAPTLAECMAGTMTTAPPRTIFTTVGSSTGGTVNVPRQWTS